MAVGFGTSETVAKLTQHQESRGYPGVFTEGPSSMAVEFDVRTQSTKFMMTADGVVTFKKGYGLSSADEWRERFQALVDG